MFFLPKNFFRTLLLAFCTITSPALATTVVEFYNTNLDHYFITADSSEAAAIDNGSAGPGWIRTGYTFKSGGSTPVCRFYGSQSPGPNSHFYTLDAAECEGLKQLQASTPATEKRWNFESLDFFSSPPTNGTCPAWAEPVYRAYNNGFSHGVDSNHRITSSLTALQEVVTRGWSNEGVVMCAGTLPALGDVFFTNRAGDQFVSHGAYVGWVELFVDPLVGTGTVVAAIQQGGGSIVAQTPRIGLYVIQVGTGNENVFLNAMYGNVWVNEGGAVLQAVREDATFDWNFGDTSSCIKYHGSLVTDIANRLGGGFVMEPVSAFALVPQGLSDLMRSRLEAVPEGQHKVINMSIGTDPLVANNVSSLNELIGWCADLACVEKQTAFEQYFFLRRFYAEMENLYLTRPDLANRNLVSIVAGNPGVALDKQLAGLKTSFPNAFKRIVIVGGVDASGAKFTPNGDPYFNHLNDDSTGNMVYARGVGVTAISPVGPLTCDGTSFAAPEVASVLDYVWARNPSQTSEQILSALRLTLRNLNTSVIPQDANGFTTVAFLNQVLAILGVPVTPTTFTLTMNTSAGTGSGTVSANPIGPSYTSGTIVTLTATPAAGSTFTGWSGACSGTGPCVVTMNTNKTVTATFTTASIIAGSWTGSWSVTSPTQCNGLMGGWDATFTETNGVLSGSWLSSDGSSGSLSGNLSGSTATWSAGGSGSGVGFSGVISGSSISGHFTGPNCGDYGPTSGGFSGYKR